MAQGYIKKLLSKKKRIHSSHLITFFSLTILTLLTLLQVPQIQSLIQHAAATTDIDVLYIERTPRYAYDSAKNLPATGDTVTFIAHVKNRGATATGIIPYTWSIDGKAVKTATTPSLNPDQQVNIPFAWQWQTGTHTISFQADPSNIIAESSEKNNIIQQTTNSIGIGFWVEQTFYKWFNDNQNKLGIGSNSFEDWTQRMTTEWNHIFATSVYPSNPQGSKERVHIDEINVVPDGSLTSKESPNPNDKTVDLEWGLRSAEFLNKGFYDNGNGQPKTALTDNPFYIEYGIIHELSHARYLADLYAFDINADPSQGTNQSLVLKKDGAPLIPKGKSYYYICEGGMMGCRTATPDKIHVYSEDDIFALNAIAGKRAECGNSNPPCNIGIFLNNIPTSNNVKILDQNHQPITGATVYVYQSVPNTTSGIFYDKTIDNTPDITCTTNTNGTCSIGNNPFNLHITKTYDSTDWSRGVIILKITKNNLEDFRYLFIPQANDQSWNGHQTATYTFDNVNLTTSIVPSYVCGGTTNGICPTPTSAANISGGETPPPTLSPAPCTTTQSVSSSQEVARRHRHGRNRGNNNTSLIKEFLEIFQQLIGLIDKLLGNQVTPIPTETPVPTVVPSTVPTIVPCPRATPTNTPMPSPNPSITTEPSTAPSSTSIPSNQPTPTVAVSLAPTNTTTPTNSISLIPSNNPTPTIFDTPLPTISSEPSIQPTEKISPTPSTTPPPNNNSNFAIAIIKLLLDLLNNILNLFLSLIKR